MKGLELAKAYYDTYGKQMIHTLFPEYEGKIAIGLAGQGSECFGFDDELSTDHDFGPCFCLWLTPEIYRAIGQDLQNAYNQLPKSFMGFAAREESPHSGDRVGVQAIDTFYRRQIGRPDAQLSLIEWLYTPESRLATVTNGQVFHDPLGEFSRIRNDLLRFYPEDVRIKKIAARAVTMAQAGQYNYARCMCRGETVAAQLALSEFVRHTVSMVFLLNKKYMPFYKWMHRALRELPVLGTIHGLLQELSVNGLSLDSWRNAPPKELLMTLNMGDKNVAIIEEICGMVKNQLQDEGLTHCDDTFLAAHAGDIMRHIADETIKSMHMLEG